MEREYALVRLDGKVYLAPREEMRRMEAVAKAMASTKKQGRMGRLLEIEGTQYFLDGELLGTFEEMTGRMRHLDGDALALFLSLPEEKREKRARALLAKGSMLVVVADTLLVVASVMALGVLLLR